MINRFLTFFFSILVVLTITPHKANAIITYEGETITFIKCVSTEEKREYIKTIYDTIILSLRDKGMPKVINDGCKKWVFNDSKMHGLIKYKGSLHIRMK